MCFLLEGVLALMTTLLVVVIIVFFGAILRLAVREIWLDIFPKE